MLVRQCVYKLEMLHRGIVSCSREPDFLDGRVIFRQYFEYLNSEYFDRALL